MKKGFTIVELMISTAVLAVIIWGIFVILNTSDIILNTDIGLVDLQQEVRQAMDGMIKEIRNSNVTAGQGDLTILPGNAAIQFKVPIDITSTPVLYSGFIKYSSIGNQIIREYPAGDPAVIPGVLANNISSLSFSLTGNIVQVEISGSKTIRQKVLSFPDLNTTGVSVLTEKARLRNQ